LAVRDGNSTNLAYAYFLQLTTRYQRADFLGAKLRDDVATHHARNRIGV
jgi:hypothetical protein